MSYNQSGVFRAHKTLEGRSMKSLFNVLNLFMWEKYKRLQLVAESVSLNFCLTSSVTKMCSVKAMVTSHRNINNFFSWNKLWLTWINLRHKLTAKSTFVFDLISKRSCHFCQRRFCRVTKSHAKTRKSFFSWKWNYRWMRVYVELYFLQSSYSLI